SHATETVINGNTAYLVDAMAGSLTAVNLTTGATQPLLGSALGFAGATAVTFFTDQNGTFVYVVGSNGTDNTIAVFRDTGAATNPLQFVDALYNGRGGVRGIVQPSDVEVSPDGRYVFVTGEGGTSLAVFQRNATTGDLAFGQVLRQLVGGIQGLDGPTQLLFGG